MAPLCLFQLFILVSGFSTNHIALNNPWRHFPNKKTSRKISLKNMSINAQKEYMYVEYYSEPTSDMSQIRREIKAISNNTHYWSVWTSVNIMTFQFSIYLFCVLYDLVYLNVYSKMFKHLKDVVSYDLCMVTFHALIT